jgi:lipopolysaccharide biosynthesis regulator YciM
LLILAELHREADRLEDAVMACERASRIQGFEADALILQGRIEAERERYARAVELLEAAQSFEDRPYVARYLEQLRRMLR